MNTKRRVFIALAGIVLLLAMAALWACKPKTEEPDKEKATLTLEAGSGTLQENSFELEAGSDLYAFLQDKQPAPEEGLTFAGWYLGNAPVANGATMPETGATVTAKYYAEYTLELYLEGQDAPRTHTGSGIYGEELTVDAPEVDHYTFDAGHEGGKLSAGKLGKGEVFKAYYTVDTYSVVYDPAAPAEASLTGTIDPESVKYGESVTVAGGEAFTVHPAYRFAGWSDERGGAVKYQKGDKLAPEASTVLYGVWDVAYTDRFGGEDYLFLPQAKPGEAVLLRAGIEHTGTREGETFSFKDAEGHEILKGKAAAGTFVYFREALTGVTYKHVSAYTNAAEDDATLAFDGFGGATYTDKEGAHKGTVSYDPSAMTYRFLYEGTEQGFEFMLSEAAGEHVFTVAGTEQGVYAQLLLYYVGGADRVEAVQGDLLLLDGYGTALILDGDAYMESETLSVILFGTYAPSEDAEGEIVIDYGEYPAEDTHRYGNKVLLRTYGSVPVWYSAAGYGMIEEGTLTAADGSKLELDGYGATYESAVYTDKENTRKTGMYTVESTPLGVSIRFIPEQGDVLTFRVNGGTFSLLGGGDYFEYLRFYGFAGVYDVGGEQYRLDVNSPVLTLEEDEEGNTVGKLYYEREPVVGTVTPVQGAAGRYLFTAEVGEQTLAFEFETGAGYFELMEMMGYFHYFKCYPVSQSAASFVLTEEGGEGTIVATWNENGSGEALYTDAAGKERLGVYTVMQGSTFGLDFAFAEFMDIVTGETFYFRLTYDESKELYTQYALLGAETGVYLLYEGGALDSTVRLFLCADGTERTGAYFITKEDGTAAVCFGTYTYENGEGVFTYKESDDAAAKTLDFLCLETEGTAAFAVHTALWTGEKTFTHDGHTLILDGYCFATYDGLGAEYAFVGTTSSRIYLYGETAEGIFEGYFDVDIEKGTYAPCGYEWGTYYDDSSDDLLVLDGYGRVTKYNINETEGENLKALATGTYRVLDDEEGYVEVTLGSDKFIIHIFAMLGDEGTTFFYTVEDGKAGTYTSSKWELISLDGFGAAIYTDALGLTYEGSYVMRSENVLAFTADTLESTVYVVLGADNTCTVPTGGFVVDGTVLVKYLGGGKDVVLDEDITEIAPLAFSEHVNGSDYEGAAIKSIDLKNVTKVGENAFNGCESLTSVTGAQLITVEASAFYACYNLVTLNLPKLETIGELAFHLCESLKDIGFDCVTAVYSSAFSACHELETVDLPKVQKIYEGVFYDCFMLRTVTLGNTLTQMGTPEEPVAGVFERSYGEEQVPLTLILEGSTPPVIGLQLFAGVNYYTVKVPTMSAVKAFYADESWAEYNPYVGTTTEYDGVYYNYSSRYAFILDGVFRRLYGGLEVIGAYQVEDGTLYAYTFNAYSQEKYIKEAYGIFDEKGTEITYELYGTPNYYVKAGVELSFHVTETEEDTLVFTPQAGVFYKAGEIYRAPAKYTKSGTVLDAWVVPQLDNYGYATYSLECGGYSYPVTFYYKSGSYEENSVYIGDPTFIPVVTTYEAEDTSYLALSQNDAQATKYTASFVIASIRNDADQPLSVSQAAVEKQADGSFKMMSPILFNEHNYLLTFTVDETAGTFTYAVEAQRRIEIKSDSFEVIIFLNADGSIASVTPYVFYYESYYALDEQTKNYTFIHTDGSMTYEWLIYDYNYAGHYTLTLTGSGETLSGTIASGSVAKGFLLGVYATAFLQDGTIETLWMKEPSGQYTNVTESLVAKQEYYELVLNGCTYYISAKGSLLDLIIADKTYTSDEYSDEQGTLRVVCTPEGEISFTLTVEGKQYTQFISAEDSYVIYGEGTYFEVTYSATGCRISRVRLLTVTHEESKFTVSAIVRENNEVVCIFSAEIDGKPVETTFKCDYFNDQDYLLVTLVEQRETYLIGIMEESIDLLKQTTLESADGSFRVTFTYSSDGLIMSVEKFETLESGAFVEREITYTAKPSANYEVDVMPDYGYENREWYYLSLTSNEDGSFTLTVQEDEGNS